MPFYSDNALSFLQVINVEDFQGVGETCPEPYFYQNLGEAEYVVATYMYTRHPRKKKKERK